ncbi:MAG: alpha/beta hydrolase [Dehalococcoidia bacterium]
MPTIEPESRFYTSQRLKLHYAVWGDESKPPLVLVHGTRDHARSWDGVAQALLDRYCVYAPDLRGHGDSDWPAGGQYSLPDFMPEFVLDMAGLVEVIGRAPLTLIGHSLGGGVALHYAGVYPERVEKVVSIELLGPPPMPGRAGYERILTWVDHVQKAERRAPRRYPSVEAATARMLEENPRLAAETAQHLALHGTRANEDGSYSWKFDPFLRVFSPREFRIEDAREIWYRIRCPVLLIRGTERGADQETTTAEQRACFKTTAGRSSKARAIGSTTTIPRRS